MTKTAVTIYPNSISGLERFLAHVSAEKLFTRIIILALPEHTAEAEIAVGKHGELDCVICEYPPFAQYPEYYCYEGIKSLSADTKKQIKNAVGVVVTSGQATPYAFLRDIQSPPLKPFYNHFRILKGLGAGEMMNYTLNALENQRMAYTLDDFAGIHKGKRCFIVGNGPSLKLTDMSKLKDEITFGSNRVFLGFKDWGFPVKYWGILDNRQIETYCEEWEKNVDDGIIKFAPFEYSRLLNLKNCCPVNTFHNANFSYPHNHFDPSRDKEDYLSKFMFSTSPDVVYLGFTVTYMLIQLAVIMGCNPIYLIGMDHKYNVSAEERKKGFWKGGSSANHFHRDYGVNRQFNLPDEEMMEMFFDYADDFCTRHGVKIYNASKETALHSFEKVEYDSLFDGSFTPASPAVTAEKKESKDYKGRCRVAVFGRGESDESRAFFEPVDKFNIPKEINAVLDGVDAEYCFIPAGDGETDKNWLKNALEILEGDGSIGAVTGISAEGYKYATFARSAPLLIRKSGMRFSEYFSVSLYKEDFCLRIWEWGGKVACLVGGAVESHGREEAGFMVMDEAQFQKRWKPKYEMIKSFAEEKCGAECIITDINETQKPKQNAPQKAELPSVMTLLVAERLKNIAAKAKGRVAVFGAGQHTLWLEKLYAVHGGLPKIDAVLDDSVDNKPEFFGVKPMPAAEFKAEKGDVIILSSDCHQTVMGKRCRELYGELAEIADLYLGLPAGPHDKA